MYTNFEVLGGSRPEFHKFLADKEFLTTASTSQENIHVLVWWRATNLTTILNIRRII